MASATSTTGAPMTASEEGTITGGVIATWRPETVAPLNRVARRAPER